MKKTFVASLALITLLSSLTGCKTTVKPHITIAPSESEAIPADTEPDAALPSESAENTDISPDATDSTEAIPGETAAPAELPTGFVANNNVWVDIYFTDNGSFYVPKLRDDSEDASAVNTELSDLLSRIIQDEECTGSDFVYFENGDNIFSLLIIVHYSSGNDHYKCVTYNKEEGIRYTNEDILAYAGVEEDSLYAVAAAGIRQLISARTPADDIIFTNGELNSESSLGQLVASSEGAQSAYSETFAESSINTDMPMFLNEDNELCFCSGVISETGESTVNEAYSSSGKTYKEALDDVVCGSAHMLDINMDGIKEYVDIYDSSVVIYRISADAKEELLTVESTSLSVTRAYFFDEDGFESKPVLRADLGSNGSSASYEIIVVSYDYSEINTYELSWTDSNEDGLISEEDSFILNGDLSSYSEWYDLTGIG